MGTWGNRREPDGHAWITGPREGSLEPELARSLQRVLAVTTTGSEPCWFGIWEGFGYLSEAQRGAPSIDAPARRWHLFRAPLDHLRFSFGKGFEHQTANLAWPEDRSWCLATEIDAEATYVGGSKELISAIFEEPTLEAEPACLGERLAYLGEVLKPIVKKRASASLRPGFESREFPVGRNELGLGRMRLGTVISWILRLMPPWRKDQDGMFRSGLFTVSWGRKRRNNRK